MLSTIKIITITYNQLTSSHYQYLNNYTKYYFIHLSQRHFIRKQFKLLILELIFINRNYYTPHDYTPAPKTLCLDTVANSRHAANLKFLHNKTYLVILIILLFFLLCPSKFLIVAHANLTHILFPNTHPPLIMVRINYWYGCMPFANSNPNFQIFT